MVLTFIEFDGGSFIRIASSVVGETPCADRGITMRVPVDQTAFADGIRFQFAEPVAVYENNRRVDGKQAVDADGVPLWSVQILILRAGRRSELETVKVPSIVAINIPPTTPIVFDGLTATTWENNGRSGISLSARGIAEA